MTSAAACINVAGAYVVAVETQLRELTETEEGEFQLAMYGKGADPKNGEAADMPLGWLPTE